MADLGALRGPALPTPASRGALDLGRRGGGGGLVRLAIADHDGAVLGAVLGATDMTLQRAATRALEVAKAEAEASAEAKSSFLANMSHEIRTPMNGVIGMISLLRDRPLDEAQRQYVDFIQTSGEALLTVTDDILDPYEFESGRLELEERVWSPTSCAHDALQILGPAARRRGAKPVRPEALRSVPRRAARATRGARPEG